MADLNSMEFKSNQDLANDPNMMAVGVIKRRMTKEERLKAKELAKEGGDLSHVPKFIADAPWYMSDGAKGPTLSHQKYGRLETDRFGMETGEWYARGQRVGPAATKYRKGACQNCGAMTHAAKDCFDRPRKLGAKYTGKDIQPDEVIRAFDQSFEGKRDRWNGYDNREYTRTMEEYERLEEARKALREEKRKIDATKEDDGVLSEDEDKYEYEPDTPGQGYDEKTRTSVRNLRLREDIAKYLQNNKTSSHYDPKSRSMRELPDGTQTGEDAKLQTGMQEFHRSRGDASEFDKLQNFAWQSERIGGDVHLQANPTAGELKHRKAVEETEKKKSAVRSSVLEKYGGSEHFAVPPKELLKSTEQFVEYTKMGEVIQGKEVPKAKSRYVENVYINNHTSVYGSWFRNGKWGYACCHQFHKNTYCTGNAGIEADEAAQRRAKGEIEEMPPPPPPKEPTKSADRGEVKRKRQHEEGLKYDGRSMTDADRAIISEDEYEEYRRNKIARSDDPLLAMKALEGTV